MAAFSYQHPPFLVDSVSLPNFPLKTPKLFDEFVPNSNQFRPNSWNQPLIHQVGSLLDASTHDSSCVEQQSINTEKQRTYQSLLSMADKAMSGEHFTQNSASLDKKRKSRNGSSSNSANSKDVKQMKCKKQKGDKESVNVKNDKDRRNQATEEPPKGYIHVRARRGQATDSHSLAERVRREKISEKMKMLQALVPGCDKVTGKALMLDEIINYVQSLQNQVELLSMKLASFDPMVYTFGLMDLDPMAFPAQGMNNSMGLPMDPLTQSVTASATSSSTAQPLTFGDTNTITSSTASTTTTATFPCPLVDTSTCLLQQEQKQNVIPLQEGRSSYWGVLDDHHRQQSIINQFGFGANFLYSL